MTELNQNGPELLVFGLSILFLCLFVWTVSGMFPAEFRPPALRRRAGPILLYGAILVVGALGLHIVHFAVQRIAWPAAVILGGLILLASPFVHGALPRAVRDGAAGVLCLAAGGLVLHGALALA